MHFIMLWRLQWTKSHCVTNYKDIYTYIYKAYPINKKEYKKKLNKCNILYYTHYEVYNR